MSPEETAIRHGLALAPDLLMAQRMGRLEQMLPELNTIEPAALGYAVLRLAQIADELALQVCGGNKRRALELIRTAARSAQADATATIQRLDGGYTHD